jgi:hypothetical protein
MAVSEVEQDVACHDNHSEQFRQICALIDNPSVGSVDALRLVMLFALRYETNKPDKVRAVASASVLWRACALQCTCRGSAGSLCVWLMQIEELKQRLMSMKGLAASDIRLIDAVLAYGGVGSRGGDLFGNRSIIGKLSSSVKVRGAAYHAAACHVVAAVRSRCLDVGIEGRGQCVHATRAVAVLHTGGASRCRVCLWRFASRTVALAFRLPLSAATVQGQAQQEPVPVSWCRNARRSHFHCCGVHHRRQHVRGGSQGGGAEPRRGQPAHRAWWHHGAQLEEVGGAGCDARCGAVGAVACSSPSLMRRAASCTSCRHSGVPLWMFTVTTVAVVVMVPVLAPAQALALAPAVTDGEASCG